jgi:hypothetical protein
MEFNLMTADLKRQQREQQRRVVDPPYALRLTYGKEPLTSALSRIVEYVTQKYHYTSLQELNSIFRLYNVEAYSGRPGTKLYQDRGLLYRALNEHGQYIGRPVKASFFDCKPTLDNLERRFAQNLAFKEANKERVAMCATFVLRNKPDNLKNIHNSLFQDQIQLVIHQDKTGAVRQVTYIDTKNRLAINGEELPSVCSAQSIQQLLERQKARLQLEQAQQPIQNEAHHRRHSRHL